MPGLPDVLVFDVVCAAAQYRVGEEVRLWVNKVRPCIRPPPPPVPVAVRRLKLAQGLSAFSHLRRGVVLAYPLCERGRLRQVGPYNNPQETYNYYYLPFCQPSGKGEKPAHKWGGLGEVLQGNELIDSQLDLKFRSAPCSRSCRGLPHLWGGLKGMAGQQGLSTHSSGTLLQSACIPP